jgi:hypothetical protein
MTRQFIPLLSA